MPDIKLSGRPGEILIAAVFLALTIASACSSPEPAIRRAINAQLKSYPASTLRDLYKSFFQDEYGPGHMQPDSAGAAKYLEYELSEMTSRGNYLAEPCGAGKHFCRVPLDLVKDSIVPKEVFLDAFLESAKGFKAAELEEWKSKWEEILGEITAMDLDLPDFEEDKRSLAEMLESGEAIVHHSQAFVDHYDPHYRIMSLDQWEKINSRFLNPDSKLLD